MVNDQYALREEKNKRFRRQYKLPCRSNFRVEIGLDIVPDKVLETLKIGTEDQQNWL